MCRRKNLPPREDVKKLPLDDAATSPCRGRVPFARKHTPTRVANRVANQSANIDVCQFCQFVVVINIDVVGRQFFASVGVAG